MKHKVSKLKKCKSKHLKGQGKLNPQITTSAEDVPLPTTSKIVVEDNVWSEQLQIEDDKPREDDFEDYLEQLLF